jgi:exodeoxyribonuclease V alpha subunit
VKLSAKTIHRLLESNGVAFQRESLSAPSLDREGKVRDPAYDIVIVDEVSMVDAPLMEELLRRIDFFKTRLILVGDHNQLPPVGAGNVHSG